MANRRTLIASLTLTLALIAFNLVAFNALLSGWATARIDLTQDNLYSISDSTRKILSGLDEDVLIHGYFSKRTHPKLAPLVPRIVDLLHEYEALSRGHVKIAIIDPGEDEEAEQEANERFGVESTPFRMASKYESGIVNAYFNLVVKYGDQYVRYGFDDLIAIDPLPDGDIEVRLRNLEYDLTRAIKKVVYGFRSTAELFERVEEPLRFTVVMTPDSLPEIFQDIPEAIRTAAEELGEKGGDRFIYEEIVPVDEVTVAEVDSRFGARPMTLGLFEQSQFYLYGFLETDGRLEQLMLAGEGVSAAAIREAIENVLRRQTPGFLKTVGVVAPQPSIPPEIMMQLQMQGRMPPQPPPEFQQVKAYLEQDYEIRDVDLESKSGVPSEVDILLVLKPKTLSERAVYGIDQYLMRGGKVILAAGNYEADFGAEGLNVNAVETGIDDWLAHQGVTIPKVLVLDDRNQPLPIPEVRSTAFGNIRTWRLAPYPYLVEVKEEGFVSEEIAAGLGAMGVYWGSPIEIDEDKTGDIEVIEILRSSEVSWTSDDLTGVGYIDYEVPEETETRLLAVALAGRFESFFAGKAPPGSPEPPLGAEDEEVTMPEGPSEVVLEESPETRLVVIANAEFLSDFVARALGATDAGFFTENLAFVENLIDWTSLDNDMIAIRSRGAGARRIDPVDTGKQVMIESLNYLLPVVFLLALGAWRLWRRRNTTPIIGA
jgi:ABC-2 type transport system permease protein